MAQLAIGLAGAAVGNFIAPGIGGQVGFALATTAAGYYLADDVETHGPRIEDGAVTTSAYGRILPKVWGVYPVAGNIIDASPVREVADEEDAGGKGGPSNTHTTFTYFSDMDVALHDGEIQAVLQIKANGRTIFDASPSAGVVKPDWLHFTLYMGTTTQDPDPTMEAVHGAGNVPAYRDTAHIVFRDFPHSEFGNSFAINFEFLIAVAASQETALQATQVMATGEDSENQGGLIEPSTDLLIFPLARISGQTYAITAVNPLTRGIVWQTPPGGIHDFGSPTLKPKITFTDAGVIASPGEIAVIAGEEANNQAIWTIDAISGEVLDVSPDKAGTKILKSLVYDWFDVNPAAMPWYMVDRGAFAGYDFYYGFDTQTEIEPPSGWYFRPDIYSDGEGHILVSLVDADIGATAWAVAILDTQTMSWSGPTAISDYVRYAVWTGDDWWVLENNTHTVFKVFDETAILQATYNWNSLYSISGSPTVSGVGSIFYADGDNALMFQITSSLYQWRLSDTGLTPAIYPLSPGGAFTLYHSVSGRAWWSANNDEDAYSANLFAASGTVATLDAVVSDLSINGTELTASDIDVADLSVFDVRGMGISTPMARRNVIAMLQAAYLFDYVPRSGNLTAIVRGQAASVTLTEDEIGAHIDGGTPPPPWTIKRADGASLPDMVEVTFVDPDHNYEAATQSARRLASDGGTTKRVSLALALSNDEGAQIADTHLHLAYIEAEQYETTTMPSTIDDVQPGEVLSAEVDGVSYTFRAVDASIIDGRMISLSASREVPEVFASYAVGGSPRDTSGTVTVLGATILWPLDIPMLRAIDNDNGAYMAASSFTTGWPGAEVQRSTDGLSYSRVDTLTMQAVMGTATNVVTGKAGFWNTQDTLNIRLIAGSLSSTTRDTPSYAAYGSNGRFEIIAFATASQLADGRWTVSDIAHGLRDTFGAVDSHAIGDQFIVLDAAALGRVVYSASSIDAVEILRGVTLGRTSASAVDVRYTFVSESLTCFAPTRLHGEVDGSGNWDLEWTRQDRVPGRAFWSPGNSEDSESYTVEILDSDDVVKRTISVDTNSYEYTSADQTTDFGKNIDELNWRVAQVSALTGAGHTAQSAVGVEFNYPGTVLADSPYIYWRLDETSGTTADDAADNIDGTYSGAPTLGESPIIRTGTSVDFDGSADYIGASISGEPTNWLRSIEVFFRIDSFPGSNYEALVAHERVGNASYTLYLSIASDSKLHLLMYGSGGVLILDVTGAVLSTGTDYHAIVNMSFSGTRSATIYLNDTTYGTGTTASIFSLTADVLRVGNSTEHAGHGFFDGHIDDVSFYKSEQDAAQRADHFLRGGVA